mgnify:CR=1 FL=1
MIYMKNIVLLFIIFAFYSCEKKEHKISILLVETLIESSNFYQSECNKIEESIRYKYDDNGTKNIIPKQWISLNSRFTVDINFNKNPVE